MSLYVCVCLLNALEADSVLDRMLVVFDLSELFFKSTNTRTHTRIIFTVSLHKISTMPPGDLCMFVCLYAARLSEQEGRGSHGEEDKDSPPSREQVAAALVQAQGLPVGVL